MNYPILSSLFLSTALMSSSLFATSPAETLNKVDINTADATQISHVLKGIGAKRAQAIITYRDQHHGFHSLEELGDVPRIGKRFVQQHLAEIQAAYQVSPIQDNK